MLWSRKPGTDRDLRPVGVLITVVRVVGGLCVATGLLEMVAWWARITAILQWPGGSSPMAFNTALAMASVGAAFIGWAAGWRWVVVAGATVNVVLGVLVLAEYVLGRTLGIEELFATAYLDQPAPGRLALNTAVCLVLAGAGLLVATVPSLSWRDVALAVTSGLVAGIAVMSLLGQATAEEWAYSWGQRTGMAMGTSLAALVVAVGLSAMAVLQGQRRRTWLGLPAIVVALAVGLGAWFAFTERVRHGGAVTGPDATRAAVALAVLVVGLVALVAGLAMRAEQGREQAEEETARRAVAEQAVRVSEALLFESASYTRSLIEASLDPLVMISADGTITDVNEATIRATGVPREQLVGSDASQYFTDPAVARAGYQRAFAEGRVTDVPLTMRHVSGTLTEVLYNATVYRNRAGEVAGVFAAARDITDRLRAEQELARRAAELDGANLELERSNADLEQFAYVASHELTEPLRAISGPIQFVAEQYKGRPLDDKAEEFLGFALDGSLRMKRLLDDLLTYSRVGRLEGQRVPTRADSAVQQAIDNLASTLAGTDAEITTVAELPTVRAEPNQLTQVFQNLISNAVKFTPSGVRPCVIIAGEPADAGMWRFTVTDNGIGIDAGQRERIFAMFKRLHRTDEYPGTGIGLAVVKKIIERHGGEVGVEPTPTGTGSQFWFTLPAGEEVTRSAAHDRNE